MKDEQPPVPSSIVPDREDYESTDVESIFASSDIQLPAKLVHRVDHRALVEQIFGSFHDPWITNIHELDSDDK